MAGGGAPVDGGAAAAAGSVCVGTGDDGITLCGAAMDGGFTGSVPSITVPFSEGRLTLGTWQQIIFVDFDTRPRARKLVVQLVGE